MSRSFFTTAISTALFTAGCSSVSFPTLPSFSLLEGDDGTPALSSGGTIPLPSRPDYFRYDEASTRTTIRFARGSSLFEDTVSPLLAPLRKALALDPQARLLITGFASRGAAPGADRVLGEQRALAIREALIQSPTPSSLSSRIHTTSYGSDRPPAGLSAPSDQVDLTLFSSSSPSPGNVDITEPSS